MKVNMRKTEYMCVNERQVNGTVKMQGEEVAKVEGIKYGGTDGQQDAEMEVADMKMLRFSLGVTRMDKIRNEYIRGTTQVRQFGEKIREA